VFIPTASQLEPSAHQLHNPEFPLSLLCSTQILHKFEKHKENNAQCKKKDVQTFSQIQFVLKIDNKVQEQKKSDQFSNS